MFEAWQVAVRIKLINEVSGGLMGLSRQFGKTSMEAKVLQKHLDGIKKTMLVGAGLTAAGGGLFYLIGKTLPAAKEYANQLSLMNTLGMKQADIAKVVGQAWKTTYEVPTTTAAGNLAAFRELRSVFGVGHEDEASSMLPVVGRLEGVLTALTGKPQEHVGFDLVKAIELRTGVMTKEALQHNSELMSRTLIAMGGTLTVSDFHGALKMGKMATNKWDDDFTYNYLPTLMQELKTGHGGAQSAGTMLQSYSQAVHGRMTKAAMPYWVKAGLISESDVVRNAGGQWQTKPGSTKGIKDFEANPYQWTESVLAPAVDKLSKMMNVSTETAINAMFSNRNSAFVPYNMITKALQYERDKKTINQADSMGAYKTLLDTNPDLAFMALQKQWTNLLAVIGYTIMPDLIKGTQALIPVIQDLTKWMNANPNGAKIFVRTLAGVAGVLSFAGTVTMTAGTTSALALMFKILKGAPAAAELATAARGIGAVEGALVLFAAVPLLGVAAGLIAFAAATAGLMWLVDPSMGKNAKLGGSVGKDGVWHPSKGQVVLGEGFHPRSMSSLMGQPDPWGLNTPAAKAPPVHVTVQTNLDGRRMWDVLSGHAASSLGGSAQKGGSMFDPGATLAPVGGGSW